MENTMETNAVSGGIIDNTLLRRVEGKIDKENAQKEAFGDGQEESTLEAMEFEYFKNALDMVRNFGNESSSKFSGELKSKIAEATAVDESQIRIFNANGTPLDAYHKISAFVDVVCESARGGKITVTLDVFTEEKNKRGRADVQFQKPECGFNPDADEYEQYTNTLDAVSDEVGQKIRDIKNKIEAERLKTKGLTNSGKGRRIVRFGPDGTIQ